MAILPGEPGLAVPLLFRCSLSIHALQYIPTQAGKGPAVKEEECISWMMDVPVYLIPSTFIVIQSNQRRVFVPHVQTISIYPS